jgi:hypothetical protein
MVAMLMKLLTSQLAGYLGMGGSLLLGLGLLFTVVTKNSEISSLRKKLSAEREATQILRQDNTTLRGNALALESALAQCNAGVDALKVTTDAITNAGVKALQEVQKAGSSVSRKVRDIEAMPKETCEDAFKILKSN